MTIKELSEKSNLHENYVAALEKGERNPSIRVMKSIADAFCIKINVLLGEDDEFLTLL